MSTATEQLRETCPGNVIDLQARRAARSSRCPTPGANRAHAATPDPTRTSRLLPPGVAPAIQPQLDPRAEVLLVGRADLGLGLDQLVNLIAHASIGLVFAERAIATTLINPEQVNRRTASDLSFDPITEKLYQWVYRRGVSRLRLVPGQVEFAELQYLVREAGLPHGMLRADLDAGMPHALLAIGPINDTVTSGRLGEHLERLALPGNLSPVVMG
jgi:hypothetical protein